MEAEEIAEYTRVAIRLVEQYGDWEKSWDDGDHSGLAEMERSLPRILEYFRLLANVAAPPEQTRRAVLALQEAAWPVILIRISANERLNLSTTAMRYAKHHGSKEAQSGYLRHMAVSLREMGRTREAVTHLVNSASLIRSTDQYKHIEAEIRGELSGCFRALGEYEKAKHATEESLRLIGEAEFSDLVGCLTCDLGSIAFELGEYDAAKAELLKAVDILEAREQWMEAGVAHGNLGAVYSVIGDKEQSQLSFEKSLSCSRKYQRNDQIASRMIALATLARESNSPDIALQIANDALSLARDQGLSAETVFALYEVAGSLFEFDRFDESCTALLEAEQLARESGNLQSLANAQSLRGRILVDMGLFEEAITLLHETRKSFQDLCDPHGAAGIELNIAIAFEASSQTSQAIEAAIKSYRQYSVIGAGDFAVVQDWAADKLGVDISSLVSET